MRRSTSLHLRRQPEGAWARDDEDRDGSLSRQAQLSERRSTYGVFLHLAAWTRHRPAVSHVRLLETFHDPRHQTGTPAKALASQGGNKGAERTHRPWNGSPCP